MLGLPCQITKEAETHTPGLVFVDSFRSVSLAAEGTTYSTLQRFIQSLGVRLTGWQVTTFLIGEYCNENDPNPIFTIADGLIWLTHSAYKNSVVRKIEIAKMRGQPTLAALHTFRMNSVGIKIFPPAQFSVPTGSEAKLPSTTYLKMAIPGLDEMMGGGLPLRRRQIVNVLIAHYRHVRHAKFLPVLN